MRNKTWDEEDLAQAIRDNVSIAGVLTQLGLKPIGGNYKTVQIYASKLQLDMSHFTGQGWNVGNKARLTNGLFLPLSEILIENSPYRNTARLKDKLVQASLLEYRCIECGLYEWLGKRLSLHLDHMNGDSSDNRLSNLRLLCPNCHSQTETYCRKKRVLVVER